MKGQDTAASVHARLLSNAKAEKQDFNLALTRYALGRLIYRLTQSWYARSSGYNAVLPGGNVEANGLKNEQCTGGFPIAIRQRITAACRPDCEIHSRS